MIAALMTVQAVLGRVLEHQHRDVAWIRARRFPVRRWRLVSRMVRDLGGLRIRWPFNFCRA